MSWYAITMTRKHSRPNKPTDGGRYLLSVRKSLKLTQTTVMKMSGVSQSYINQLENGTIVQPSPNFLYKLATVYDVSYHELMKKFGYGDLIESVSSVKNPVIPGSRIDKESFQGLTIGEQDSIVRYIQFFRSQRTQVYGKDI